MRWRVRALGDHRWQLIERQSWWARLIRREPSRCVVWILQYGSAISGSYRYEPDGAPVIENDVIAAIRAAHVAAQDQLPLPVARQLVG